MGSRRGADSRKREWVIGSQPWNYGRGEGEEEVEEEERKKRRVGTDRWVSLFFSLFIC